MWKGANDLTSCVHFFAESKEEMHQIHSRPLALLTRENYFGSPSISNMLKTFNYTNHLPN